MTTSVSSLQKKILALTKGKVDIMFDANTFKNTTQILRELSVVWDDMTDINQAAALEALGGKRQANILASIINNFDIVENSIEAALDSENSAIIENEKYLSSIQGRVDQFTNALQTMWNSEINSDLIKSFVDLGTEIIHVVDNIGLFKIAIVGLATKELGSILLPQILTFITGTKTLNGALKVLMFGADAAGQSLLQLLITSGKSVAQAAQNIPTWVSLGHALGGVKGAAVGLGNGLSALWAAIPGVGKIVLIAAAIAAVVTIVDKLTMSTKETAEAAKKAIDNYQQAQNVLKSNKKTIADISDDYKKLSKGVDNFGNNISLTTEEYERYNEITNQIESMFPAMISGYTDEGAAIIATKGSVDELTKAYQEQAQAAKDALLLSQSDVWKNLNNSLYGGFNKTGLSSSKMAMEELFTAIQNQDADQVEYLTKNFNTVFQPILGVNHASYETVIEKLDLIQAAYRTTIREINTEITQVKPILSAFLQQDADYNKLSDTAKDMVKTLVSSFDAEVYQQFSSGREGIVEMQSWIIDNIVLPLQDSSIEPEFQATFDLQTKLNNGEATIEEYENQVRGLITLIDALDLDNEDAIIKSVKLLFNFETVGDEEGYRLTARNAAKELLQDQYDDRVITLSDEDLNLIDKYVSEWKIDDSTLLSWDELKKKIEETTQVVDDSSITDSLSSIKSLESAYNSLGDAIKEFKEDGTVAAETLESLKETFGETDGFEELYSVLATGEGNVEEAITNVANAYIAQKGFLADLSEDEIDIMVARLKSLGVINAEEVLQTQQVAQAKLNALGEQYSIDLSNYATAEEAKLAIAQQLNLNVNGIEENTIKELANKYGADLINYTSVAEAKIEAARRVAKAEAESNRSQALSKLTTNGLNGEEDSRRYQNARARIEADYQAAIAAIPSDTAFNNIKDIVENAYKSFTFDFSGDKVGIGRDFDEQIKTKAGEAFDKLKKKYENQISQLENQQKYIENEISRLEAENQQVGKGLYEEQIRLEQKKLKLYEQERAELLTQMNSVAKGSDEWYEYAEAVWGVEHSIQESTLAVVEFKQAITNLYVEAFDKINKAYDNLNALFDKRQEYIQNEIDYAELLNKTIDPNSYDSILKIQNDEIVTYDGRIQSLQNTLNNLSKDSPEYLEKKLEIYDEILAKQQAEINLEETKEKKRQQYVTNFENIKKRYDDLEDHLGSRVENIRAQLDLLDAEDKQKPSSAYIEINDILNEQLKLNQEEAKTLRQELQDAINSGDIEEGSEEWATMAEGIQAADDEVLKFKKDIIDVNEELKQLYVKAFDDAQTAFNNLSDLYSDRQSYIESYMKYMSLTDEQVPADMYNVAIETEQKNIETQTENLKTARIKLADAMANGVEEGDEDWVRMEDDIRSTEKAILDSKIAIEEYKKAQTDLYTASFDNIKSAFDNLSTLYNDKISYIESYLKLMELQGSQIPADAYSYFIDETNNDIADKMEELNSLRAQLAVAMANGVKEGDEEWIKMESDIRAVEKAILDNKIAIEEYKKAQKDLYVESFNKTKSAFDSKDAFYNDKQSYVDSYMKYMELQGESASAGAYTYLIEQENQKIEANIQELNSLRSRLSDAMANGVEEGDEEWIQMESDIRATEKAILDGKIAVEEYNKSLKNLYVDAFNNIKDAFGNQGSAYDDQKSYIESYISYLEALGVDVPTEMYQKLIAVEEQKKDANIKQLAALRLSLAQLEAQGYTASDDEWISAQQSIREVEAAILDSDVAIAQYNKSIREADYGKFDEFIKRLENISSEIDRVNNLLDDEDVATEDGTWTDEGLTRLGLMYQQMELSKQQAAEYAKEINELNAQYAAGTIGEQEYNDRLTELKNGQWDAIESYESAKDAIVDINEARIDMIEEGVQKEIEAYQELIDTKKDELNAEKDLFDFRQNVQNQTKNIAALERRIAAMSGSTDAATIAERTKLQAELLEARQGLDDTYYDRATTEQSNALDDESESYNKSKDKYIEDLREALKDTEKIVAESIETIFENADKILAQLNTVANTHSVTLSDWLINPWKKGATSIADFQNDVTLSIDTIRLIVESATSPLTASLSLPWEVAANRATNTFSPAVTAALSNATIKAQLEALNISKSFDTSFMASGESANTFDTAAEAAMQRAVDKAQENANSVSSAFDASYVASGESANTFDVNADAAMQRVVDKAKEDATSVSEDFDESYLASGASADTFSDKVEEVLGKVATDTAAKTPDLAEDLKAPPNEGEDEYEDFWDKIEEILIKLLEKAIETDALLIDPLTNAPTQGKNAWDLFAQSVTDAFKTAVSAATDAATDIGKNMDSIKQKANDAATAIANVGSNSSSTTYTPPPTTTTTPSTPPLSEEEQKKINDITSLQKIMNAWYGQRVEVNGRYTKDTRAGVKEMQGRLNVKVDGWYGKDTEKALIKAMTQQGMSGWFQRNGVYIPPALYAKGTLGTKKDQWAITDEYGPELTLVPTDAGNLSFMRAGTGVIPAQLTKELMKIGEVGLNGLMQTPNFDSGINVINNAISKPEYNFSFDALVKADHIDEGSLPALKKMVQEQLDAFSRRLGYSLKKVGAT